MDIWRWVRDAQDELVESGRARLAELVEAIPTFVVDLRHAELDAAVPEALALAREAKNTWLELFIRHWNLQSRILHRYEVSSFLPEAVRLIELASRDEARDCPQSVCVTQDLACCYAKIDDLGYVDERLAVAKETLDRIDARWPCFTCISSEYAEALIDGGQAERALAFLDAQAAELARVGRAQAAHNLAGMRVDALFALGRVEEALSAIERAMAAANDESDRVTYALDRALALAKLGQNDEAARALASLPFERVLSTQSFYARWSEIVTILALAGATPNTFRLDAQLRTLAKTLADNGVIRTSIGIEERRARLALARAMPAVARDAAASIRALVPRLRAPLGADRALDDLERAIAEHEERQAREAPSPALPQTPDEALARLDDDPEKGSFELAAARARFPDDARLALAHAAALRARGLEGEAEALLEAQLDAYPAHPGARDILAALGKSMIDGGRFAAARALCERALARAEGAGGAAEIALAARVILVESYRRQGKLAEARPHVEALCAARPGDLRAELMLVTLDRDMGRYDEALARLDQLIEARPEPGDHDWERLVVATLLGRWDKVRASARRLGMKVDEGSEPIDEAWSLCRVAFTEPSGEREARYAIRTGPATARVIEISHPREAQHYRDEVVIDPAAENGPPAPGEGEKHTYVYAVIETLRQGGYRSFLLDGLHPGREALAALADALASIGVQLSVRSDDAYEIEDPEGGAPLRGLFAYMALPAERSPLELHTLLKAQAHTLVWPDLLQELELEDEIAAQAAIIERYGL